ncbi:MAG TPA: carbohydrate ABC transporter permease [Candidatus Atribacteria bacterium]|nr:carbohydrate ABC transporter permease [Candidatus Atribacteria bacterium]
MYLILFGFTILTLYPLIWMVINSFKTTQEFLMNPLGLPNRWFFKNYPLAWRLANFSTLFLNSILYTGISTIGIIFFSLAAAFAFAKIKSKATSFLYGGFLIGILFTIESLMIPLYLMSFTLGLTDTRIGVLIPYIGLGLPIGIYLCTEFIKSLPDSVVEAARIDGASYFKIFLYIIIPMAKPVIATVAIMNALGIWNEFMLINILVSRGDLLSLPVGIMKFSGALASDYGKQFAALVIGTVPTVSFYLVLRNRITQGVAAGATKG